MAGQCNAELLLLVLNHYLLSRRTLHPSTVTSSDSRQSLGRSVATPDPMLCWHAHQRTVQPFTVSDIDACTLKHMPLCTRHTATDVCRRTSSC
jgi:hypothetical protein